MKLSNLMALESMRIMANSDVNKLEREKEGLVKQLSVTINLLKTSK
jgi:hypothetical protein